MIAIACDHSALELKAEVEALLTTRGLEYRDFGTYTPESCHYPVYGARAARAVASGECDRGIVICGTGIGMSIAANKIRGIRAAAVSEVYSAKLTRMHNNSNVLCFGARVIGIETAKMLVDAFLEAEFEGGRHAGRVELITALENGKSVQ